jgi:hypothetical protein
MNSTNENIDSMFTIDDVFEELQRLNEIRLRSSVFRIGKSQDTATEDSYEDEIQKLIETWEKQKEKFRYVFETEKGSKYFVLNDGKVIRFKKKYGKWDIVNGVNITEHIVFLDEKTFNELLEIDRDYGLQDEIVRISSDRGIPVSESPEEGLYPFDFRLYNYSNKISFSIKDGVLRITDELGPFASGYHFGHKIVGIL